MEFTVVDTAGDVSHVALAGRMDPHATQRIRDRLRAETVARARPAVVDLTGVSFMTSVGIGLIVDCADSLRRAGHTMVVVKARGHVDDVFRKTGIYTIVSAVDTVEEALALVADSGA